MKNIFEIFRRDVRRISHNVIALIVILGLIIVPCLYAWFNIAACWDPYGNTGKIKIAVASVDEGYEGELISLNVNIGDTVLSSLRENTQMDWIFTSKKKALNGVESGKYYAAIVIPETFSNDMMSVFSEDIQSPEITYYYNAKENAIAPKVTDKGASAVQTQVNEVFIKTIANTVLDALQTVSNTADESGADAIVSNLTTNLDRINNSLTTVTGTLQSYARMTEAAQVMLDTTSAFLKQSQETSGNSLNSLKDTQKSFNTIQDAISGTTDSINDALTSSTDFYIQISKTLDSTLQSQKKDNAAMANTLNTLAKEVDTLTQPYITLRDLCVEIGNQYPAVSDATGTLVGKLNESIASQNALRDKLNSAADALRSSSTDAASAKAEIDQFIQSSSQDLKNVQSDYESSVKDQLNQLLNSMKSTDSTVSSLLSQIDQSASGVYTLSGSASSDLSQIKTALENSCTLLQNSSDKISDTLQKLDEIQESGDYSQMQDLLSGNHESISSFLASPVELNTNKLYPVENYGSSMAPFYSTLAMWVGGTILVAMLKVSISESSLKGMKKVRDYQVYFGRYIVFLLIGLAQSTLIGLGDLLYLRIQCEAPFLFMLACWITSLVYVNVIYTLTVSFGDVGKAIAVILMVIQVAGSGGTFPIEVAPKIFQSVYPLMPFAHSMAALRETIGGLYGSTYWTELGYLCIFLIASLFLGLVLRKPIIKLNEKINEKLESTHLI